MIGSRYRKQIKGSGAEIKEHMEGSINGGGVPLNHPFQWDFP